jgi:hypothetical protein
VEEEVECTLNHECPQYLRRSGGRDSTRRFGNCPRIVSTYEKATAVVAAADRGRNRWDVPLTHASLPHMKTRGVVVVTLKSKRRDITLRHCTGRSVGSEPEATQVSRGRAPASGRMVAASRISRGAGMSRDGR